MQRSMLMVLVAATVCAACAGCTSEGEKKAAVPEPVAAVPKPVAVPQAGAWAIVKESSGGVKYHRGDETGQAPGGMVLRNDDIVLTEKDGHVALEFHNGTIVRLSPSTYIKLNDVLLAGRKTLDIGLIMGRIWIKAANLRGQRLEVTAPTAVAGVRGTQFYAAAAADGSLRVGVEDGVVEVRSPRATRSVRLNEEVVVDAMTAIDTAKAFKMDDWEPWLAAKRADVARDPLKVAALYGRAVLESGAATGGLVKNAEGVLGELQGSEGVDRDAKKAQFADAMDEARSMQDMAEIQMELLGKLMVDMSADPSVKKETKEAFEAQVKKTREAAQAPASDREMRLKALEAQAKPAFASAGSPPPTMPTLDLPKARPVQTPRGDKSEAKPGTVGQAGGGSAASQGQGQGPTMAKVEELAKEAKAVENAGDGDKKVAMIGAEKPVEEATPQKAAPLKKVEEFQKALKESEQKLVSIAAQGEVYDNKTRASMVRSEAKRIAALLPGLRALGAEVLQRAKEAKDAAEGKTFFQQGQQAQLLITEIESKILWCDSQAKHYEDMKAE